MQIQNINNAIPMKVLQSTPGAGKPAFAPGDTFEAKIVNIEDNVITLQQADGTTIKAQNLSGTPLHIGDTIQLMITSADQGTATGSMVAVNGQPITQNITDAQMQLTNIGASSSHENVQLANLFSKFNYPMTKESFDHLVKILETFPNLQEDLAVFMAANHIEPTEENVQSLQNIGNLHQEIQTIVDEINTVLTHLPLDQFAQAEEAATVLPNSSAQVHPESASVTVAENTIDISGFLQQVAQDGSFTEQLPQITQQAVNFVLSSLPEHEQTPLVQKLLTTVVTDTIAQLEQPTQQPLQQPTQMTLPPQVQQLIDALPEPTAQHVMELVPQMQALTNKFLALYSVEDVKSSLFAKVTEELSGNIIKQTMENTPGKLLELGTLRLSESWQQVANSVKLGEQSMTYMQIPIQIMNREHTGELYVFKRPGKSKQAGDDSTKVVFALNTENIGRFESILTANKLDLQLNIRLENQRVKDLVDNNLDMLQRMLDKTQYNIISLTTTTIAKPITVSNVHEIFGYKQLDITI